MRVFPSIVLHRTVTSWPQASDVIARRMTHKELRMYQDFPFDLPDPGLKEPLKSKQLNKQVYIDVGSLRQRGLRKQVIAVRYFSLFFSFWPHAASPT